MVIRRNPAIAGRCQVQRLAGRTARFRGGYRNVIGDQECSGHILAGLFQAGARLIKAFGTVSDRFTVGVAQPNSIPRHR